MFDSNLTDCNIFLGPRCNLSCQHCAIEFSKQKKNYEFEAILSHIDFFRYLNLGRLVLTGGEPCLRKDLPDIILFAKEIGFKQIHLQTNATFLSYSQIEKKIVDAGLTSALVSLLGHNSSIHDNITRRPGSFERTTKGIQNLLKYPDIKVSINIVISPTNYKFLRNIVEYIIIHSPNVNTICFSYPQISGGVLLNFPHLSPKVSVVSPYLIDAVEIAQKNGYWTWISDFPLCYMAGFEEHSSHVFPRISMCIDSSSDIYANPTDINYPEIELRETKVKPLNCKKCTYDQICVGMDKKYLDFYGYDEFVGMER